MPEKYKRTAQERIAEIKKLDEWLILKGYKPIEALDLLGQKRISSSNELKIDSKNKSK